jgi:hypothetical protein
MVYVLSSDLGAAEPAGAADPPAAGAAEVPAAGVLDLEPHAVTITKDKTTKEMSKNLKFFFNVNPPHEYNFF